MIGFLGVNVLLFIYLFIYLSDNSLMIILGLGLGHKWWRVALEKGADHLIHTGLRGCIKVCNAQQPSKDVPENND